MSNTTYEAVFSYMPEEPLEPIYKITRDGVESFDFEIDEALAILLIEGHVFVNSPWWIKEWPEEARKGFAVLVNCNDVFAWGCADAETCLFSEFEDLFEHYVKDKIWGPSIWCIKKRGILPQKPVFKKIEELGIWDLGSMNLSKGVDGDINDLRN